MRGIAYGGDYNPEQWPEEIWARGRPADARGRGEPGQRRDLLLGAAGAGAGAYEFGWLDQVAGPAARRRASRSTSATPTAAPPAWFCCAAPRGLPGHPRRAPRSAAAAAQRFCPSSPAYRAAAAGITDAARPSATPAHPAVALWHVHNEYGGADRRVLLRDVAPRRSAAGCADRYGDLAALNEAWGTAFWGQRYGAWEEIDAAAAHHHRGQPGPAAGLHALLLRRALACFRRERDILHRLTPGVPVTTNFMSDQLQVDGLLGMGAARSTSSPTTTTCAPSGPDNHIELAMAADLTRSLAGGALAADGALDGRGQLAAAQHRQAAGGDAPQQPRARGARRRTRCCSSSGAPRGSMRPAPWWRRKPLT